MHIPVETLSHVRSLYDRGLHLQAYQTAIAHAPLNEWTETEDRILAGRMVMQLGGNRLGSAYHLRAWRSDRTSAMAAYFYGRTLLSRKGLLVAWEFVRSIEDWPEATDRERAEWWCCRAQLLSHFRDFDEAIELIDRSIAIDPGNYWLHVSKAWLWEEQDLYAQAKDTATEALILKPYDPAATLTIARMLTLLERDDEALELLQATAVKTESSSIVHTLAQLQTELGDYVAAQQSYQRYAELTPLIEPLGKQWLLARQTDLAYALGDFAATSRLAAQVESSFYQKIAERLQAQPLIGKRVLLPVGFVRQHHVTCAPATLATLTRFWEQPVDHLSIAAEICYDGTAADRERLWAEQNGWIAREFTVTWESAVALIDRGIPFTLGTIEPTSGHLQAVIGYDSYLQQFLIRDPYNRQIGEMWAQELLAHYAAFGPRGMVLLPQDKSHLLTDLDLPDADLYDRSYELQGALEHNRRETASQVFQQMVAIAPTHRLTLDAERLIAGYDGDETRVLAAIEKSLLQFPDCGNLILGKLSCLQELARREERLEILANMCAIDGHPVFLQSYAQEIGADGRSVKLAISLLRRTIRQMPTSAQNYYALARILWLQREYDLAFELYRFATCLEDKKSTYAKTYFFTARHRKQTKPALKLLEQRWHRFGTKSAEPLLTLFWAYSQLNRMTEAFELLDTAIIDCEGQNTPQQRELLMAAANAYAEYGRYPQTQAILDCTRDTVSVSTWRRIAAELAAKQGDITASLGHWQAILAIEPLALDVNRAVANLLAETQGVVAALDFLKTACTRFPHSYSLHQLWSCWLLEVEDLPGTEQVLRHIVQIDASDAWTRRQLARVLGTQRKLSAAFVEIDIARELEPLSPSERAMRGYLHELSGENAAAKTAYKEAIKLSIDSDGAIACLLSLCYAQEERKESLAFIFDELKQQVTMGDALTIYQAQAANSLPSETLLAQMQEAWTERPDLWQAWSALILQLLQFERLDEALALAQNFTEQFPLMPKAWLDLSTIYRQQGDNEHETIALQRSLAIDPTWNISIGRLSRVYERTEQFELGKELLAAAILREPRDFSNHCHLAELLWRTDDRQAALERLKIVVQTTSSGHNYAWAWEKLKEWSHICECPEFAIELVRTLTHTHPLDARSWYFLADTLPDEDRPEGILALDRAIELDPYYTDAYDLKARLLVRDNQHEAALAVCNTTTWTEDRPISLRSRAVWVEQQWGKHQDAMHHLRELVAISPDFEWAWLQLAQYFDRSNNLAEYLPAAQKLVELDPNDPINWGYLGDAYNRTGDLANAQAAWEKSLEIMPSYDYGGISLFELHWKTEDFYAAASTFAKIQPHLEPVTYLPLQIRLAVHYQDYPAAESDLAKLCHCELDNSDGIKSAIFAMKSAGLATNVEKILYKQLSQATVSPAVQFVWLGNAAELDRWEKIDRFIQSMDFRTDLGQQVVRSYLQLLGKHQQKKILFKFIDRSDRSLRSETLLWGTVGLALRLMYADLKVIKWLADWETRADVEPWMLVNLTEANICNIKTV
jgi:cellulose synthase operon protein C